MKNCVRFSAILAGCLALTLSLKTFVAASVLRPYDQDSTNAAQVALAHQGLQIAGLTTFSGRLALIAGRDSCIMYFVPVSEQGWHQETVRKGLLAGQKLWFLFNGKIYPQNQPRWETLSSFYVSFALAYAGLGQGYNPVYAIVASEDCDMRSIDWGAFKSVPYRKESLFSHAAEDI